jgi:hypothetical protein
VLVIVAWALFGQSSVAPNKASMPLPKFEDYSVPTPVAKRTASAFLNWPDEPDETTTHFHRRILEAAQKGPDIAGTYAVVRSGCGSDCNNIWIVDAKKGDMLDTPFIGATRCVPFSDGPLLSYRLDSRLLIVTGSLEIPHGKKSFTNGSCGRFYYVVERPRLRLIRSVVPLQ